MDSFEFVSTEDAQTELVLPFPSTGFTLGSAATCDVKLPGNVAADLALRVDVSPTGAVQVTALRGALAIDGVATTSSPVRLGQVVRLGTAGLLLRRVSTGPQTIRQRTGPSGNGHEKTATTSILAPGTVVAGRYEVVARLASGAMGDVYRVEHASLRKSFALKVLKPDYADAHRNLAAVLAHLGRLSEAGTHLRAYVRLHPDDQAARAELARLQTLARP